MRNAIWQKVNNNVTNREERVSSFVVSRGEKEMGRRRKGVLFLKKRAPAYLEVKLLHRYLCAHKRDLSVSSYRRLATSVTQRCKVSVSLARLALVPRSRGKETDPLSSPRRSKNLTKVLST